MARRPSAQTVAVLDVLARDPDTARYGYDLCKELALKAGTLYPILIRLCERGLLEATWEKNPPTGRPPRHLYQILPSGVRLLEETQAHHGYQPSHLSHLSQQSQPSRQSQPSQPSRPSRAPGDAALGGAW